MTRHQQKPHSRALRIAQITACVFAVGFFVAYFSIYQVQRGRNAGYGKVDLAVFYVAGKTMIGQTSIQPIDLYGKPIKPLIKEVRKQGGGTRFLYLPQSALFFIPVSLLSFRHAVIATVLFNSMCFVATYYMSIYGLLRDNILRFRYSVLLMLLVGADTVRNLMSTGQVNAFVWLMMVSGVWLMYRKRQNWPVVLGAGSAFAMAVSLKVFPGVYMVYALVRKQWKIFAVSCGASALLWLMSLPFFGVQGMLTFFTTIFPKLLSGKINNLDHSTSLLGSFSKAVSADTAWMTPIAHPAMLKTTASHVIMTLAVVILVMIFYLIYRYRTDDDQHRPLFEYSVLILFVLLFSSYIHTQYHFWILPIIIYLFHFSIRRWQSIPYFALGVITLICTQFASLLPFKPATTFWIFKAPTLSMLVLFIFAVLWLYPPARKRLVRSE